MKKQVLHFLVSLLAFNIGLVSVATLSFESNEFEILTKHKNIENLTFKSVDVDACGMDWATGIAYRNIESSDGEKLVSTTRDFETEVAANKWIKSKTENADKIIESEFLLDERGNNLGEKAIFESNGKGFILKHWKGSENYDSPSINLIEAPTLQHAIAYDKSQKQTILEKDTTTDELFEMK